MNSPILQSQFAESVYAISGLVFGMQSSKFFRDLAEDQCQRSAGAAAGPEDAPLVSFMLAAASPARLLLSLPFPWAYPSSLVCHRGCAARFPDSSRVRPARRTAAQSSPRRYPRVPWSDVA